MPHHSAPSRSRQARMRALGTPAVCMMLSWICTPCPHTVYYNEALTRRTMSATSCERDRQNTVASRRDATSDAVRPRVPTKAPASRCRGGCAASTPRTSTQRHASSPPCSSPRSTGLGSCCKVLSPTGATQGERPRGAKLSATGSCMQ